MKALNLELNAALSHLQLLFPGCCWNCVAFRLPAHPLSKTRSVDCSKPFSVPLCVLVFSFACCVVDAVDVVSLCSFVILTVCLYCLWKVNAMLRSLSEDTKLNTNVINTITNSLQEKLNQIQSLSAYLKSTWNPYLLHLIHVPGIIVHNFLNFWTTFLCGWCHLGQNNCNQGWIYCHYQFLSDIPCVCMYIQLLNLFYYILHY